MTLNSGQSLSHYEILAPLGSGGMGEVYRARDTNLGRDVAIKVLPAELARDEDRLQRFEREARTLASLNHPNVAGIFGVEREGEVWFLALELVPGEDLQTRFEQDALPLDEALDVCSQIAEGLEAAHAAGVIHRDLKPANIRLTPDGKVKLLDFGLAKSIHPMGGDAVPGDQWSTETGRLIGTPSYMAPEQTRGKQIDRRVDIWAFGCVLYECLTARRAFVGGSLPDVLMAIVDKEPDWVRLPRSTPPRVRQLLARCLDKNPQTRLQDIGEARIVLSNMDAASEVSEPIQTSSLAGLKGTLSTLVLVAIAAAIFMFFWRPRSKWVNPLAGATFTKLTNFPGTEFDAAVSPDGDFVAFVSDRDGPFDIWVSRVGSGEFRNLTSGQVTVWIPELRHVGFNADGSEIWIGGGTGRRMKSVSLLGGNLRNLLSAEVVNADWTRGGSRIVLHTLLSGDPLHVTTPNAALGDAIRIERPGYHQHHPVWSFDEQWIYFARGRPATGDMDLWRVRPDGSDAERMTDGKLSVAYPTPISADTVLYVARELDGAGPWLWALDTVSKTSGRVSVGVEQYISIAACAEGRRLVATVGNHDAAIYRIPIQRGVSTESNVELYSRDSARIAYAPRFRGEDLFYLSSTGTGDGLWRLRGEETSEIWSGRESPLLWPPSISPDGKSVVIAVRRGLRMVLHLMSADGAEVEVLNDEVDVRGTCSWSPDGKWIVVGGSTPDGPGLFKIPIEGGAPQRIATGGASNPVWSPIEGLIVYAGPQINAVAPLLAVRDDGSKVELPSIEVQRGGERVRFLPDGSGVVYMKGLRHSQDFWHLDLATGAIRQLTRLDGVATMRTFDITPNGEAIVFDRLRENSDIVLIDLDASFQVGEKSP